MTTPRAMPLFMAYCPDYPTTSASGAGDGDQDTYAKRLSVRQEHWARAQVDKQAGRLCYLPPPGSDIFSHPARTPQTPSPGTTPAAAPPPMAGSLMLMHYPTLQEMWDRIKSDIYWTAGVWDKEKTVVHEFIPAPAAASAPGAEAQGVGAGGAREPEKGAEDSQ